MRIDILTLFPEMFDGVLSASMLGRAQANGLIDIRVHNIRDYTDNKHKKADDYPFGGGSGMVMKPEPIFRAVERALAQPLPEPAAPSAGPEASGPPETVDFSSDEQTAIVWLAAAGLVPPLRMQTGNQASGTEG